MDTNHAQLWSVTKQGQVQMVTDFSRTFGANFDPTAMVPKEDGLLAGTLGRFPITPDSPCW